jgi:amino acid transporter
MDSERLAAENQQFEAAEYKVELRSSELKKEMRLVDLVGVQLLTIIGLTWIGTAGKLGSSHLMFWLPAVLLFYIPSGIVVAHLSEEMPLEGGMYQWARLRFGPLAGFLVAMNIWLYNVLLTSSLGLQMISMAPYSLGPAGSWLNSSKPAILSLSLAVLGALMLVAWRGLALGRRISTFGAFVTILLFAAVVLVAIPHWLAGTSAVAPVAFAFPAVSLLNMNLLGKMGFGALCGADAVAVFAGECRSANVGTAIRRSVWVAAPVIATMMVLGTASVLTFSRPDTIDLVMPPVQVLSLAAPVIGRVSSAMIVVQLLTAGCLAFTLLSRFPMVAGWDHLLPEWFSSLHPRYRTPTGSVLFAGGVAVVFAVLANLGAGNQEAYQFLLNAGLICYACAYVVLFAIPLAARGEKPSWGVLIASFLGLVMTLLFVVLSVFPIIQEQNPGLFTLKMVAVVGGLQLAGVVFFKRAAR